MVHGGKPSSNMKLLNPQFQYETFKPPVPIWNFLTPQFQYETFKLPVPIWNFLTPSSNLKLSNPSVPIWNFLTPQFQYETFKLPVPIWNFLTPSSNLKLRHGYLIIIVEKLKCKLYYWPAKNFTNTSMRHSKLSRYITRSYSLMSKFHDSLSHNIR